MVHVWQRIFLDIPELVPKFQPLNGIKPGLGFHLPVREASSECLLFSKQFCSRKRDQIKYYHLTFLAQRYLEQKSTCLEVFLKNGVPPSDTLNHLQSFVSTEPYGFRSLQVSESGFLRFVKILDIPICNEIITNSKFYIVPFYFHSNHQIFQLLLFHTWPMSWLMGILSQLYNAKALLDCKVLPNECSQRFFLSRKVISNNQGFFVLRII